MSNALSVQEKTVKEFLSDGEKNNFLIPDYQRKYEWENDEIDLLFYDLRDFTRSVVRNNGDDTYFLGTLVSYVNADGKREIIDGQQRIVSLLLLLRVIYTKLSEQKNPSEEIDEQLKKIRTTIWRRVSKGTSRVDCTKNFIRSESIDDGYKDELQLILETGKAVTKSKSRYTKNYRRLQTNYDKLWSEEYSTAAWLAYYLLEQVIVFSIEAKTRDAAITIFSTINNRGRSLSDTDIIRAKIYEFLDADEKPLFNETWRTLIGRLRDIGETSENLLSYYMYCVRALENDVDSTLKGLKKYFSQKGSERLKDKNILPTLNQIFNLWAVVNKCTELEGEPWSRNVEILKIFEMLLPFQNYAWRGSVTVYYLAHHREADFEKNFLAFLRKLFAWYVPLYILNPDRTFIRGCILRLNVEIMKSARPHFKSSMEEDHKGLKKKIISMSNLVIRKMLLKAAAYSFDEQTELLPNGFEIEHILPQKWYATYSNRGYTKEKFEEYVEQLGNLTFIEPGLNKMLSNAPFDRKKNFYRQSTISMTRALVDEHDEWTPDSIAIRSNEIAESLIKLWQKWSDDYDQ